MSSTNASNSYTYFGDPNWYKTTPPSDHTYTWSYPPYGTLTKEDLLKIEERINDLAQRLSDQGSLAPAKITKENQAECLACMENEDELCIYHEGYSKGFDDCTTRVVDAVNKAVDP